VSGVGVENGVLVRIGGVNREFGLVGCLFHLGFRN
jgi:hypothetical protein